MKLESCNPILFLEEYEDVPDDIRRLKSDEELRPGAGWGSCEQTMQDLIEADLEYVENSEKGGTGVSYVPTELCVGIGKYHTEMDGDIFLCVLLDQKNRLVLSCAFGVFQSPELVRKALEIFFMLYGDACTNGGGRVSLLSSRNPIYRTKQYDRIIDKFPVNPRMTAPGSHGQAAVVSTYFSQLMRRKGTTVFYTWQEAIDWLSGDILKYNRLRTAQNGLL